MPKKFYTGIDIGTYHVKVVIAAPPEKPDLPMQILGTGTAASRGLRHGYIVDIKEAAQSVREAVTRASAAAHVKVVSARVAIGGVGLEDMRSSADLSLTPSGGVVQEADLERIQRESVKRASAKLANKRVLHTIPLEYRIDGTPIFGSPVGLQGTKLTIDTLLITMLGKHYDDVVDAIEAAGIEVEDDAMASPIAASFVTLTKAQKMAGVVLANIGAETLSIIVYENDIPVSVKVFPIGGNVITESLALTFQMPLPEAEQAKRGAVVGSDLPDRRVQTVIQGRMKDMFTLINAHLKTIGKNRLLPAGIVITGGGSGVATASDIAKSILKLPSQIGQIGLLPRSASVDATWAVAYGLCRWGFAEDVSHEAHSFSDVVSAWWKSLKATLGSVLP
jgi:cell division protein FtsA